MGFRKKSNRHDAWQNLIAANRDVIEATDLPAEVFSDEHRFREFLVTGVFAVQSDETVVRLEELSNETLLRLEKAVNVLIDSLFFEFDRERLRRFKRFG